MKPLFPPDRLRGSIEPLEARIAPAQIFIGDPNFNNQLDTEYIELNPPARSLQFVNTSKVTDPAHPEGDPNGGPAADAISQAVDGVGTGTYYLKLNAGDQVFRFTDNGYKELMRVTGGRVIAFFTDKGAQDFEYQDGEFTGLSLGPNASVLVSEKVFGDVVTNLMPAIVRKSGVVVQPDQLDMSGLVNFRQGIRSLSVQGGSVFGNVLSGGAINQLLIGGNVEGVYAGTAALGKTYDFFPTVDGGEGQVNAIPYPKGVAGATIQRTRIATVDDGIIAGDGGFGAKGGDLINVQITQDTDGFRLVAGRGGDANLATRALHGGLGGSVLGIYVAGVLDSSPNSTLLSQKIEILAGDGGDGLANTRGGAGGLARGVFVGFEINGTLVEDSGDVLRDSVFLKAGDGGEGARGGSGGAVVRSVIRVQTPNGPLPETDRAGDEISIIAGAGGNSLSATGVAGLGGAIAGVDARNQEFTFDSDLYVKAGDAGTTVGNGNGVSGGSLTNITLQGFDVQVLAGNASVGQNGSTGRIGGAGGSITNLFLTQDENQQIITRNALIDAGKGGDATRLGAGPGGSIQGLRIENSDLVSLVVNSGVQGNGGNSLLGRGGAGGLIRSLSVVDGDSGNNLEGLIEVRSGDGGDGSVGGGAGGLIAGASFTAINTNLLAAVGKGGNAARLGAGGVGGSLNVFEFSSEGLVAAAPVFAEVTAGDGGNGAGRNGRGGMGGNARFVNVNVVANSLTDADPLNDGLRGGDSFLHAGNGGNGQANSFNASGGLLPGGAPGRGGSILISGLFVEIGAAEMRAGDAGAVGNRPAPGGSILGELDNSKLVGLRALTSLSAIAGNGSHGGARGGISNLAYGSTAGSLSPTPEGDILIQAGAGSSEGAVAGAGGNVRFIDGSISSRPASSTIIRAGDGGGHQNLAVTELVPGSAVDQEVQVIDLGQMTGVASAKFNLDFGTAVTALLAADRLNITAIQAELARTFPVGAPVASIDPLEPSKLKITFAGTGNQAPILATGYKGAFGGLGGSVAQVTIFGGGGRDVEFKVEAGNGGSAAVTGRAGGNGGSIGAVGVSPILPPADPFDDPTNPLDTEREISFRAYAETIIRSFAAGDGGDGVVRGGLGGSVVSVAVQNHDIGVRSGEVFGYATMGGIFAGAGGDASLLRGVDGRAGSVRDINADSIASIVAGRKGAPKMVERVSEIYLNDDVQLVTRAGALVDNNRFTLTFDTDTTPPIPGNATREQVEAALNLLPSIQSTGPNGAGGTVSVSNGSSGTYIVSFNATGDQVLLTGEELVPVDVTTTVAGEIVGSLTTEIRPGEVPLFPTTLQEGQQNMAVSELVSGSTLFTASELVRGDATALPPISEVQRLDLDSLLVFPTGQLSLSFGGLTAAVASPVSSAAISQALNGLSTIVAVGRVTVVQTTLGSYEVRFVEPGDQGAISGELLLPETQRVFLGTLISTPRTRFTIAYDPGAGAVSTTGLLDANLPQAQMVAQVDAALEGLTSIQGLAGPVGNKVMVTVPQPGVIDIAFNSINEKNPFVVTGFLPETQQVDLSALLNNSAFQLDYDNFPTNSIPVSADEGMIDAALEGLDTIVALPGPLGDKVTVEKAADGKVFTVTFNSNGDKIQLKAIALQSEEQTLDLNAPTSNPFNLNGVLTTPGAEFTLTVNHNLSVTEIVQGQGVPVTVTTLRPGQFDLPVVTVTPGTANTAEVQRINLGAVATQPTGMFTLTFGNTPGLDTFTFLSNATAAVIQTQLNDPLIFPSIQAAGNVTVTGNVGGPFTVTFLQAGDQVPIVGVGAVPELQGVDLGNLRVTPGGLFTLSVLDYTVNPPVVLETAGPFSATAGVGVIDAALEALPTIAALNGPNLNKVTVAVGTGIYEYSITFNGIGDKDLLLAVAGNPADLEVQRLDLTSLVPFGTDSLFNLSFKGQQAAVLVGNASAGDIDLILEGIPSIVALGALGGDNVTITETAVGSRIFEIKFNAVGDQPLISGLSRVLKPGVPPGSTLIGTTVRLPGTATADQIEEAIDQVSQVDVDVESGTTAGTFSVIFNENSDQPLISVTNYFHETQILDVYAVGQFKLGPYDPLTAAIDRLSPDAAPNAVELALEALPGVQALPGPIGDKLEVQAGPNSSYIVLFHGDGDIPDLVGTQFEAFGVTNRINGFDRDGAPGIAEQQQLSYFEKRAFNPVYFDLPPAPLAAPQPVRLPANLVGAISDINEVDANVFKSFTDNNANGIFDLGLDTLRIGTFTLGDMPIDGLLMAKVLDQRTINFTPEARYVVVRGVTDPTKYFFDNDNII